MNFFFKLNWKLTTILVTFYALFVSLCPAYASIGPTSTDKNVPKSIVNNVDKNIPSTMQSGNINSKSEKDLRQKNDNLRYKMLVEAEVKTEKERLRECLANVLLNAEKRENAHEKVLLSAAGALSNDNYGGFGNLVNVDLLKALKNNTVQGNKLVGDIFAFCKYMNDKISGLKVPNEEKVKLKVRIDELKLSAEKFALLASQPTKKEAQHENYRILDVSDRLQVLVISAGSLDGIRTGLMLNVKPADDAVLKVIAVRPFVSAAIAIKGKIGKISPGMPVEFRKN